MSARNGRFGVFGPGSNTAKAAAAFMWSAVMLLSGCGGFSGSAADSGAPIVRGAVESASITFNANGGRGATAKTIYASQLATVGSTLTLNSFTRSGFAFVRWNTSADGKGTNYSNGKAIAYPGEMTLYAVWGPSTAPGAPAVTAATATGTTASVTFAAPAFDNGSAITKYTAKSTAGGKTGTVSGPGSGTIAVTGLTPGETYTFTVTATNAKGTSALSAPSASVKMPPIAPGAPAQPTAVAGEKKATVTVTAGATGGTPASYTVTAYAETATAAGTCTVTGSSGVCDVTGLTVGTAYTFKATATNTAGTSGLSGPSSPATPFTVPGAPAIGASTATDPTSATVSFTAPASNGGSAITSYTATSDPVGGTGTLPQAGSGTITVTGLAVGIRYKFTVTATNAAGASVPSGQSNSIKTDVVPGAPEIMEVTAVSGIFVTDPTSALITFKSPASNGGSKITSFTATSDPGGISQTMFQMRGDEEFGTGVEKMTFTGLTFGIPYTFTVVARNAQGVSAASAPSASLTLVAPSAPLNDPCARPGVVNCVY